ncbi:Transcription factor E2F4 [Channa argus]|uniref:Transcription factor E2F4 n=1 Tax=Channa argus TaxID=215402 RepID=A0A6G1Q8A6_CHAAH|nr:Transcription factor E2F4 [Channa argus]
MQFETTGTVRSTPSRHEKSLGLLTMKFVSLLQEAKDGVLDLKVVSETATAGSVLLFVGGCEGGYLVFWGHRPDSRCEQRPVSHKWGQSGALICSTGALLSVSGHYLRPPRCQQGVYVKLLGLSGQKKYQVNLRSHSAPIQVLLINRDSDSKIPIVFAVPPTDDICPMLTPPSTPASLQRFPLSMSVSSASNTTSSYCSQGSLCSDHQMVLAEHDEVLTPSSTPPDVQIECHSQPVAVLDQQQMDLLGPDFQSVLDVSSFLKLNTVEDRMKDDREGTVDLIDELMSTEGIDYSYHLDGSEGVCDLFDVQILNY